LSLLAIFSFGLSVLSFFYPNGAPLTLLKFLILIEIISYLVRLVSLPVRLIANLVSGHALIKILVGFVLVLFSSTSFLKGLLFLPWLLILIILVLESVVGFLQAYVFIFLLTIYLNQALLAGKH
jgi:F-type H+-transporting ATPase subunit a